MDWMWGYLALLSHQGIKVKLSHFLNSKYHISYFYSFDVTQMYYLQLVSGYICFCSLRLEQRATLFRYNYLLEGKDWSILFVFSSVILPCGDIAALVYLWNPFTIVSCVGLSTSPIENLAVILALFGAVTRKKMMILAYWIFSTVSWHSTTDVFYPCRTSSAGCIWLSHGHTFISLSCNFDNSSMYHFLFYIFPCSSN